MRIECNHISGASNTVRKGEVIIEHSQLPGDILVYALHNSIAVTLIEHKVKSYTFSFHKIALIHIY